jgi:AcrR family transcriptional regulator
VSQGTPRSVNWERELAREDDGGWHHNVLVAAIEHFGRDGLLNASVTAIAADLGIPAADIVKEFGSKHDLYMAAVDMDSKLMFSTALDIIGPDMHGDWGQLFLTLRGQLDQRPLIHRAFKGDDLSTTDRLVILPTEARVQSILTNWLVRAQIRGDIRDDIDAAVVIDGLATVMIALLIATLQLGDVAVAHARAAGVMAVIDAVLHVPACGGKHTAR